MCTMPHNPNNVDLSRDVLFRLVTPDASEQDVERMDRNLFGPLEEAIALLSERKGAGSGNAVVRDQLVRLQALRCWFETQRSVAAWIAGVYGAMKGGEEKTRYRAMLEDMTDREIENARMLQDLLDCGVEFMAQTDLGETPLIHGSNMKNLLERKIILMEKHRRDEPYIDPDYMERMAAQPLA
jgi:hypothetical protein